MVLTFDAGRLSIRARRQNSRRSLTLSADQLKLDRAYEYAIGMELRAFA